MKCTLIGIILSMLGTICTQTLKSNRSKLYKKIQLCFAFLVSSWPWSNIKVIETGDPVKLKGGYDHVKLKLLSECLRKLHCYGFLPHQTKTDHYIDSHIYIHVTQKACSAPHTAQQLLKKLADIWKFLQCLWIV